ATTEIYTLSLHDALPIWWKSGNPGFGFPLFHRPQFPILCLPAVLSETRNTRHFHSPPSFRFFVVAPTAASFALGLALRLLILLGVLHPVARDVQLDDHAMMHQPVNGCRRHQGVFEDGFPFRERQIAGHQY